MTDTSKRRTLKGIAAVAAGTASAGIASSAFANCSNHQVAHENSSEGHLAIRTRLSAQTNNVEAVFQNAGNETLSINSLTPGGITTFRGTFDVEALTADKPLVLAPGESVSVALQAHGHGKALQLNDLMDQGQSLSRALQASASAVSTSGKPIHVSVYQTQPFA